MQSGLINRVAYVPRSTTVNGRILSYGYRSSAVSGGTASIPAQAGTPLPQAGTKPTSRKEHPSEMTTGLPALMPAQEPSDGSMPG
jgi:hypothetical protein